MTFHEKVQLYIDYGKKIRADRAQMVNPKQIQTFVQKVQNAGHTFDKKMLID